MDALQANRYEFKYLIHPGIVPSLREFIRPFARPDRFAAARAGWSYPICSLYLDTHDLELCRRTLQGEKNRYKLRIRSYSEAPEEPVFLEVKRRVDGMVLKRRSQVSRADGEAILSGGSLPPDLPDAERIGLEEFRVLTAAGARPVLRVRYLREAYEARGPEPVRLTLDTDLRHAVTGAHDLSHNGPGWVPTPVDGVVLEIKFTGRFPSWVIALVRAFGLEKLSLAKYCLSMLCAVREGRYRAPALDLPGAAAGGPG
jgi:hypothetical protein